MPRFITKTIHAYLDYPVAFGLMIMPFILNLGSVNPVAFWLSFITGIAALSLTFLTDHQLGVLRVLPYKLHLAVDFLVGVVFVIAPIALGFSGLEAAYYWVLGGTVLAVVFMHKPEESTAAI
jgi:hypothetical protein